MRALVFLTWFGVAFGCGASGYQWVHDCAGGKAAVPTAIIIGIFWPVWAGAHLAEHRKVSSCEPKSWLESTVRALYPQSKVSVWWW